MGGSIDDSQDVVNTRHGDRDVQPSSSGLAEDGRVDVVGVGVVYRPDQRSTAVGEPLQADQQGGLRRLPTGHLSRPRALGRRGVRAGGTGRRARCGHRVDGLGELQDLVGEPQQLLVLTLLSDTIIVSSPKG